MSVRIMPLFSIYPQLSVFSFPPCSSSLLLSPSSCLLYLTSSLSRCLCFFPLTCSHYLSLFLHCFYLPFLACTPSLLILPPLIHPSPLPLTVIIHPVLSFMQFSIFLFHALPLPVPLSLPHLFHFPWRPIRVMPILIGRSSFKRGLT